MENRKLNIIVYSVLILAVTFFAFLTGCKGSSSTNPVAVYYNGNSSAPQTINVNITNDGKVVKTSAPSGKMVIEAPEANSFDSDVILKITESPSVGNESSILTIGSTIYTITATKNGVPVNILNHPLNISFSNEDKLSSATNYYIGIKDINSGEWQFANVYSSNFSVRSSISSTNQFSYSIYKNNVHVALFADLRNSLQNTPKVLDFVATLTPSIITANDSVFTEDLKVNLLLSGENLSDLTADAYKIKVLYFSSDSHDTSLNVDNKTVTYLNGGLNNSNASSDGYLHYFQFVPLSTNYSAGFAPSISFDINLKDINISAFPSNFIVEISNSNSKVLSFAYSAILSFTRSSSSSNTDRDTETNTDTNTNTDTDTGTNTGTDPQLVEKAVAILKSPAVDFPSANSKVEIKFSNDIVWDDSKKAKITIDNNAVINDFSYSNKVLSLTFKDRLAYNTTYILKITDMTDVENTTLVFKTGNVGTVSLKSAATDFQVSNNKIELEFSADIPWSMADKDKIDIDNNVEITDFTYSNKILTLSLREKLKFASLYLIKINGLEGIENNTLVLRTEDNAEAVLKSDSEDVSVTAPIEVEFSKDIYFENADISNISLNNGAEIAGCSYANKVLTLRVQDKLNYDTLYTLTFNDVNGVAAGKAFNIKTQEINARPVIRLAEDSIMPNMNGRTSLQPKFFVDFGKPIAISALALKNIKLNGADLPEGCTLEFDADMQNAVLKFANNIDEAKDCILAINAYTDEDKGNINAVEFSFKTMPPENLPGSGTIDDPFLVYHQGHLSQLNNMTPINYLTGNYFFKQMDDITLTGDWTPIGDYYTNHFYGNYNGNNKVISNIKIIGDSSGCGLFSYIENGSVTNLIIRDSLMDGGSYYLGLLCGYLNNGLVENIKIEGNNTFSSNSYSWAGYQAGGLIGHANNSVIRKCIVTGTLNFYKDSDNPQGYRGGLIGWATDCEISDCCVDSPEGIVKGTYHIGGLLGLSSGCNVYQCYSNINVESRDSRVGGFSGSISESTITNCYSISQITISPYNYTYEYGGGFGGILWESTITDCYASGTIIIKNTKANSIGSIIGFYDNNNVITNTFSTVNIKIDEGVLYNYDGSSERYNPDAVGNPLWYKYSISSYDYNSEGTNYFGMGYKTTLGWNTAYWFNLTEGGFPKLIGLPNR